MQQRRPAWKRALRAVNKKRTWAVKHGARAAFNIFAAASMYPLLARDMLPMHGSAAADVRMVTLLQAHGVPGAIAVVDAIGKAGMVQERVTKFYSWVWGEPVETDAGLRLVFEKSVGQPQCPPGSFIYSLELPTPLVTDKQMLHM